MNFNKQIIETQENKFQATKERASFLKKSCKTKNYAPLPLKREMEKPKPYPFEMLGKILGNAARRIFEIVQAPDGSCGNSVLAALSLASQAFVDVQIDGRRYPTSLFLLTISESGERKSATDRIALKSVYEWQYLLIQQYKKQCVDFKIKRDIWKRKREEVLKNSENVEEDLHNLDKEPLAPLEGLILCEEPTLEGLEQLLERGQPSIGIYSDEGGRMIGGYGLSSDHALKTVCGFSNLWDGKPLTRVRKGDGNKIHFGRRVAMHLMLQPLVLSEFTKNELVIGQGFFSRCLISAPLPVSGSRKYQQVDLNQDPEIKAYYELISFILDKPYPKIQNEKGSNCNDQAFTSEDSLDPTPINLSDKAKKKWIEFHDNIDSKMSKNEIYYPIKSFASKAAEQVLRISALLAYADFIANQQVVLLIELDHVNRAIILMDYYLSEALRLLLNCETNLKIDLSEKTLDWIKKERFDQVFPLSDVYQYGPSEVRNCEKAKEIMHILENHDQVTRVMNVEIKGRMVKNAWQLSKD